MLDPISALDGIFPIIIDGVCMVKTRKEKEKEEDEDEDDGIKRIRRNNNKKKRNRNTKILSRDTLCRYHHIPKMNDIAFVVT